MTFAAKKKKGIIIIFHSISSPPSFSFSVEYYYDTGRIMAEIIIIMITHNIIKNSIMLAE